MITTEVVLTFRVIDPDTGAIIVRLADEDNTFITIENDTCQINGHVEQMRAVAEAVIRIADEIEASK